jgi:hypothetical protein
MPGESHSMESAGLNPAGISELPETLNFLALVVT